MHFISWKIDKFWGRSGKNKIVLIERSEITALHCSTLSIQTSPYISYCSVIGFSIRQRQMDAPCLQQPGFLFGGTYTALFWLSALVFSRLSDLPFSGMPWPHWFRNSELQRFYAPPWFSIMHLSFLIFIVDGRFPRPLIWKHSLRKKDGFHTTGSRRFW